jgi:hypothetical protein
MLPRLLADFILLFHFAFIVFAIFGGILVLYKRWILWIHVPVILWASVVNLADWVCPLTPLENMFYSMAGQAGYERGFIEHYITPIVYPNSMPRELELVAGVSILVWNIIVYAFVAFRVRRRH